MKSPKKQALVKLLELEKKNEELTSQLKALNEDHAAKAAEKKAEKEAEEKKN